MRSLGLPAFPGDHAKDPGRDGRAGLLVGPRDPGPEKGTLAGQSVRNGRLLLRACERSAGDPGILFGPRRLRRNLGCARTFPPAVQPAVRWSRVGTRHRAFARLDPGAPSDIRAHSSPAGADPRTSSPVEGDGPM